MKNLDENVRVLSKIVLWFGISILTLGLFMVFLVWNFLPIEIARYSVKALIYEIFEWMYFYTFLLIFFGLVFIFSYFRLLKLCNYTRIVLIIAVFLLIIPSIIELFCFFYYYPLHIFTQINIIPLILVFPLLYIMKKLKSTEIKTLFNSPSKKNFIPVVIVLFFIIVAIISIFKFFEYSYNLKYIISFEEIEKIEDGMSREEIVRYIGNPFIKYLYYSDKNLGKFYVVIKRNKVFQVYHSKLKEISSDFSENELIKLLGNPSSEMWVYSCSPYGGVARFRTLTIKNGNFTFFDF